VEPPLSADVQAPPLDNSHLSAGLRIVISKERGIPDAWRVSCTYVCDECTRLREIYWGKIRRCGELQIKGIVPDSADVERSAAMEAFMSHQARCNFDR